MTAETVLRGLGIRASDLAPEYLKWVESQGPELGHYIDEIVTDEFARKLWTKWSPGELSRIDDEEFRDAFRRLVQDCLAMGLSVERLRGVARALPAPGHEGRNWIGVFEEAVAGRERCRLQIALSPDRYRECVENTEQPEGDRWDEMLSMMRDGLFYELGIIYPDIKVTSDVELGEAAFRVEWNDLRLPPHTGLPKDRLLVSAKLAHVTSLGIDAEPAINPANGSEIASVDVTQKDACERARLTTWTWKGYMILLTSSVLRRSAGAFTNLYLIEHYLDKLAQAFPALMKEVRDRIPLEELVQVIRTLLREEISVRDLRTLLESLLAARVASNASPLDAGAIFHPATRPIHREPGSWEPPTVADYVEYARESMRRYITYKYRHRYRRVSVYEVSPEAEARLEQPADLDIEEALELLRSVRELVAELAPDVQNPVVLSSVGARARLRRWIRTEFPHLAILSRNELEPQVPIVTIGTIAPALKPYDESFYRFVDAVVGSRDSRLASVENAPGAQSGFLAKVLTESRASIVTQVVKQVRREHSRPIPNGMLRSLVGDYLDAYGDLLMTGSEQRLVDVTGCWRRALRVKRGRCSHAASLMLHVHSRVRRVAAQQSQLFFAEGSIAEIRRVLDDTAKATSRAMRLLIEPWLRDKVAGKGAP